MAFLGDFVCTMDDKGRIKMPAALRKQFDAGDGNKFMIAKDLTDNLVIYPMKTWEKQAAKLQKLDDYDPDHQKFIDVMTAGLAEVEMDSADRFLVSKSLTRYLGAGKEILMKGKFDRIQVWDAAKHDQQLQGSIANMPELARKAAAHIALNEEKGK
jgi:MraZ protein